MTAQMGGQGQLQQFSAYYMGQAQGAQQAARTAATAAADQTAAQQHVLLQQQILAQQVNAQAQVRFLLLCACDPGVGGAGCGEGGDNMGTMVQTTEVAGIKEASRDHCHT